MPSARSCCKSSMVSTRFFSCARIVTREALSQHLKGLEQQLKVRLINRTTRDMSLTDEGQRLSNVLLPALTAVERAVSELGEAHVEPFRLDLHELLAHRLAPVDGASYGRIPRMLSEIAAGVGHG